MSSIHKFNVLLWISYLSVIVRMGLLGGKEYKMKKERCWYQLGVVGK